MGKVKDYYWDEINREQEGPMAVQYCEYCDQYIDLDTNVEHFPDEYWVGDGNGKCQVELEDDEWNKQAHYGDQANKEVKEGIRQTLNQQMREKTKNTWRG